MQFVRTGFHLVLREPLKYAVASISSLSITSVLLSVVQGVLSSA